MVSYCGHLLPSALTSAVGYDSKPIKDGKPSGFLGGMGVLNKSVISVVLEDVKDVKYLTET